MQAQLKKLYCPDIVNLEEYRPEDESFCMLIQAFIGQYNGSGDESFDFVVCSPDYIAKIVEDQGFLFGKGYLLIANYTYGKLWKIIDDLCKRTSGMDWEEIAIKLSRYSNWEFEGYISE